MSADEDGPYCAICQETIGGFKPFGSPPRPSAMCPRCESLERHRMVALFLDRNRALLTPGTRVLHVAPEPAVMRFLRAQPGIQYTACAYLAPGDTHPPDVHHMDLMNAPYPDESFDLILCSHVLEHVADDLRAMREMRRILRAGGHAVILVPVRFNLESSWEDASITTKEGRLKAFGQEDHLRNYGRDFPDRLQAAGFAVQVVRLPEQDSSDLRSRFGLQAREEIYLARRGNGR
jgi:SAM-dependent methyltransferase